MDLLTNNSKTRSARVS